MKTAGLSSDPRDSHRLLHNDCHLAGRLFLLACVVLLPLTAPYVVVAASPLAATSGRRAREEAVRAIPWRELTNQQRRAVQKVVKKSSIYRRLPTQVIDCDPELFTFLMQRPDFVAETWREMGVSKLKIKRLGEQCFEAEDGLGTTGMFRFLQHQWTKDASNKALIFAEGGFEGKPFPQAIGAKCVMLLRSGSVEEVNGRTYVTARLDTFLDIDRTGVELVAKAVQPLMNRAADHNFTETLRFVSNFSRAAEKNPAGVEKFTRRLSTIDDASRKELVALCHATAERYATNRQKARIRVASLAQESD